MPMELYLYNYENSEKINNIFSWNPDDPQWWVTGFNPDYINNVDVTKQVVVGKIDFSGGNESMYEKFIHEMQENELNQKLNSYLYFDDNSYTVWMMW